MAKLSVRIDLVPGGRIGPGKIALLERVESEGSIAAAGRAMGMSYRRAWELVDAMNRTFARPVVSTRMGGKTGGGARLTEFGRELVAHYRSIEAQAHASTESHLRALDAAVASAEPG
jgi:molybdate transport system regulatory protein